MMLFENASAAWDKGELKLAYQLFLEGAESGDDSCQINIAYFFDEGVGIDKNEQKAIYWYKKAYHCGNCAAANNLALIYLNRNESKKALWWFRKAVLLGNEDSLFEIARIYELGLGIQSNLIKAISCYQRVLDSDNCCEYIQEQALQSLKRLKT